MKIGFFGGSFNPPTLAHINLAKKALKECNLDKVIFVPVGDFYDKRELASARHRYNMLKISINGQDKLGVSDFELNVKQRLYAVDVFRIIKENHQNDDIYFIMGADNFINILKWKDADELIKEYKYIVLDREEIDVKGYIYRLEIDKTKITIIQNEHYNKCSSSIFRRMQKEDVISDEVMNYINENALYFSENKKYN